MSEDDLTVAPDSKNSIESLPNSLLAVLAEKLVTNGSCRDFIKLSLASKSIWNTMEHLSTFWIQQTDRLGWTCSQVPLSEAWPYFRYRMKLRHKLRRRLKTYRKFLNLASFMSCRPPAPLSAITFAEERLGCPLPWELFELYRSMDGQDDSYFHRISFFQGGARMLQLGEMVEQALERHDSSTIRDAYSEVLLSSAEDGTPVWLEPENSTTMNTEGSYEGLRAYQPASENEAAPAVLLPISTEIRGRRHYCMDLQGRVWLISGFNHLHVSDSLSELLHRTLI